jgi:hypothetical protein
MRKTFPRNLRIEIFEWGYDSLDSCGDQCVGARRRATVMCVWLERDVSCAAARSFACELERDRFRVLDLFEDVETLPDDLTRGTHNHATHQWSGTHLPDAP